MHSKDAEWRLLDQMITTVLRAKGWSTGFGEARTKRTHSLQFLVASVNTSCTQSVATVLRMRSSCCYGFHGFFVEPIALAVIDKEFGKNKIPNGFQVRETILVWLWELGL